MTSTLQLSADGELIAALCGSGEGEALHDSHLAVVHLASGTMRSFPLSHSQLTDIIQCRFTEVIWSPDNRSVLVRDEVSPYTEVFSFGRRAD